MPSMEIIPLQITFIQLKLDGGLYDGKLSLTMTGYWKINLQLANTEGTILKGEEITETVTASSIFFEINFNFLLIKGRYDK